MTKTQLFASALTLTLSNRWEMCATLESTGSFIHSLDRIDSRGPSRRLPVTTIDSPVPFCSDAKWRAVCNVVEPRLTWTTAWSTPAWVWTDVPSHTDGLPQGSMCRDVTLQPYNMAKQLQPPPVDYLLYMRASRTWCIQNFVIADEIEPLEDPAAWCCSSNQNSNQSQLARKNSLRWLQRQDCVSPLPHLVGPVPDITYIVLVGR